MGLEYSRARTRRNRNRARAAKNAMPAASPCLVTNTAGETLRTEAAAGRADYSKQQSITLALTTPKPP